MGHPKIKNKTTYKFVKRLKNVKKNNLLQHFVVISLQYNFEQYLVL